MHNSPAKKHPPKARLWSYALFLAFQIVSCVCAAQSTVVTSNKGILLALRQAIVPTLFTPSDSQKFQFLSPAIPLTSGVVPPPELALFDNVPLRGGDVFAPGTKSIAKQLAILAPDIEISTPTLTASQARSVEAAKKLLFVGSSSLIKSKEYKTYLDYEEKDKKLQKDIGQTDNSAERSNLLQQITSLEEDWATFGRRAEVSDAEETLKRYSSDQVSQLYIDWQTLVQAHNSSDYSALWDTVASMSDWTAVTFSITAQNASDATISLASGGVTNASQPLTRIYKISMKVRVFRIPRKALEHPFLRSPNWRNTRSYVLSDGNIGSNPAELVPRVVTQIVLVKGLEFAFSSDDGWRAVSDAVSSNSDVYCGGLPVKVRGASSPFLSPRYVSVPQPFVIAAITSWLPKTPNPDPTDSWSYPWW